jgi:hypothetical protein
MMHGLHRARNKKQGAMARRPILSTHILCALIMKPRNGAERLRFHCHGHDLE